LTSVGNVAAGLDVELSSPQALKANNAKATVLIKESFLTVFILNSVLLPSVGFPRLIKSPYKLNFLNIPLFMRFRKRFDSEKIRKIGWIIAANMLRTAE
jgi:hypothetical protein